MGTGLRSYAAALFPVKSTRDAPGDGKIFGKSIISSIGSGTRES